MIPSLKHYLKTLAKKVIHFIVEKKTLKEKAIMVLCAVALIVGIAMSVHKTIISAKTEEFMTITISGNVYYPGMYSVDTETTLGEVIDLAGGLKEDNAAVDREAVLLSSQTLVIPFPVQYISLNQATASELATLKGIGATLANRIIAYREEQGYFTRVSEVLNVKGMTTAIYDANKDIFTL